MKKFIKINAIILVIGFVLTIIGGALIVNYRSYFNGKTVSYMETLSADEIKDISRLKIDAGFASLKIVAGDGFSLKADEVPEALAAHLEFSGDTAELKLDDFNGKDLLKSSGINVNSKGEYTLTVPEDMKFENLSVDFYFGKLTAGDLRAENADVQLSYSDSELNLGVCGNLNINTNFGDTDIDLGAEKLLKMTLSSNFGDCDIKNAVITGSASIGNSFGDMDVFLIGNDYDFYSSNAFGDIRKNGGNSSGSVKVEVSNAFGESDVSAN